MKKGGCILLSSDKKKIGLVYREKLKDYTFPKGHIEDGETILECALREAEEETGRRCKLLSDEVIGIISYDNFEGKIEVYMYLAIDCGCTDKVIAEKDKETLKWININDVEKVLSYSDLKDFWNEVKTDIYRY